MWEDLIVSETDNQLHIDEEKNDDNDECYKYDNSCDNKVTFSKDIHHCVCLLKLLKKQRHQCICLKKYKNG